MRLFDRNAKFRSRLRAGRFLDDAKDMLPLLKGTVSKADLPSFIVEPADTDELRATMEFAAEKHLRIAVGSGLEPMTVRDLAGSILILTSRLSSSPIISSVRRTVRASAGLSAESLAIDLNRDAMEWWPLHPVPHGKSVGALIAEGWEGLRNFRRGGTLAHIQQIEWMGYDGRLYSTGLSSPEGAGFLFGSRAGLGVITSTVLSLQTALQEHSAVIVEFSSAQEAAVCVSDLAAMDPQPESVVFWGKTATDIIRSGNDGTITDSARCVVLAEWSVPDVQLPEPWNLAAVSFVSESEVRALWQDVLRLPRTAMRLYPDRVGARLRLPLEALSPLEAAADEVGRDSNLAIALWGTLELGYAHLWVMLPDRELLTRTRGREVLNRMVDVAISLGGREAVGDKGVHRRAVHSTPEGKYAAALRSLVRDRCDPKSMHLDVNGN